MTPQQALNMVDNALGQLSLNRGDHVRLIQAVQILRETIGKANNAAPAAEDEGGEAAKAE